MVDPGEYAEFVSALPPRFEASLMNGDAVSTAFYEARRAGWELDQLVGDAAFALGSRSSGSVGLVVTRLRALATQRPIGQRPVRRPHSFTAPTYRFIPPSWVDERMALLTRIWKEPAFWTGESAHEAMVALIAEQKTRP